MIEIIYRYDPDNPEPEREPATPAEARGLLESGNREFAAIANDLDPDVGLRRVIPVSAADLGLGTGDPHAFTHQPFAIVVGCADARVPTELIFGQGANDLFVLRVAGNVLGAEVLGSIDYALDHLSGSVRLVVVLGHSGCGAVTAATDAFLHPANYLALAAEHHLRTIVNQIVPAVRLADQSLASVHGPEVRDQPGYREALLDTSVVVNAGLVAATLQHHVRSAGSTQVEVAFAVYDLASRSAGIPGIGEGGSFRPGLQPPPENRDAFARQAEVYAATNRIRDLLATAPKPGAH